MAPTVYQCFAPRVFLSREDYIGENFGKIKIRRPMDSVKVMVRQGLPPLTPRSALGGS